MAFPRESFTAEVRLTPAVVTEYAHAAGDTNPVHHDAAFAAATRYGRPIASGTHTTAQFENRGQTDLSTRRKNRALGQIRLSPVFKPTGCCRDSRHRIIPRGERLAWSSGCASAARSMPTKRFAWSGW